MRVLYLTINRKTFGTARILCDWLTLGRNCGIEGHVAVVADDELANWCREREVPLRAGPMPWPTWSNPIHSQWHAWRVARFAKIHGVELIHCNEHDCHPFATQVQRYHRVPIVCHARFKLERAFVQWAFGGKRRPAALLWTSKQQQEDCREATTGIVPDEAQHVINLGIDLTRFGNSADRRADVRAKWSFDDEHIVIGYATVLQPRKRLFDFVDTVAELAARDPRVVGVLAGHVYPEQEGYRDKVLKHIESKALGKRFLWLGRLDPIEPFMHATDIFVSTSEYETFGMSVCEAMACRRPVVAYEGGSVREVVGEAGIIVPNGDARVLVDSLTTLINAPSLRTKLGLAGFNRVKETYNPQEAVRKLAGIYEAVLAQVTRRQE